MTESGKFSVKKWKKTDNCRKSDSRTGRKIDRKQRNTGWKATAKWLAEAAIDLIFPRRCVLIPFDRRKEGVCDGCRPKIRYIREPFCMRCGRQLGREQGEYCRDCAWREHAFRQNVTLFDYGSMADSLFRFKYRGRQEYAAFYGKELYRSYQEWLAVRKPDALVPVPCHSSRRRRRGYNQSELLAESLSAASGIPVRKDLIRRAHKTGQQKNLTLWERQNNLKKAFKICQNDVKLSTIVIIDDIYTTGSTMDAMAEEFHRSGVRNIYGMVLASGRGV